ncbi:MAG: hypothetical protein N2235_10580 [Fischerella sp.]|nr:hypothetical protein [Fischerella sp.]
MSKWEPRYHSIRTAAQKEIGAEKMSWIRRGSKIYIVITFYQGTWRTLTTPNTVKKFLEGFYNIAECTSWRGSSATYRVIDIFKELRNGFSDTN